MLISDFLGEDDALLRAARERITAGADVLAIHIVAREELDPSRAAIIAQDPERAELKRSLVDETRAGYREAFARVARRDGARMARGGRGVLRGAGGRGGGSRGAADRIAGDAGAGEGRVTFLAPWALWAAGR